MVTIPKHILAYYVMKQNGGRMKMQQGNFIRRMEAFGEELRKDPAKCLEFIQNIQGPPHIVLEGSEKTAMQIILATLEPFRTTNNQRFWTDFYRYNKRVYTMTYFDDDDFEIDEYDQNNYPGLK